MTGWNSVRRQLHQEPASQPGCDVEHIEQRDRTSRQTLELPETNTRFDPVPDQIRVEFKALSEKVSVTSTVDGNLAYDEVTPGCPEDVHGDTGIKLVLSWLCR